MNREQRERLAAIYDSAVETHLFGDAEFMARLKAVTDPDECRTMVKERIDRVTAQLRQEAREAFGH